MTAIRPRCTQCGTPLPADARFCEMCGAATKAASDGAQPSGQAEMVIGHLPAERIEEGKGFLGRVKFSQINIVITTSRLLCLRETNEMNEKWLAEEERLNQEERRTGLPWRSLIDSYDWRGPLWATFYETPPDKLLAGDPRNEAIDVAGVQQATITLDEELDKLSLVLTAGPTLRFQLFNQVGRAAARFLSQALGAHRVRLVPPGG